MTGFILYEGPSQLDGAPIVCIATKPAVDKRKQFKTQGMWATYIIRSDLDPVEAVKHGDDSSVCGDCIHRGPGNGLRSDGLGRSCYVPLWGGVRNVWLAYKRGKYDQQPEFGNCEFIDEVVRVGAYGDPAAVPIKVWGEWLWYARTVGYTHQWRDRRFEELKKWCMASCESEDDVYTARAREWRTFRVRSSDSLVMPREVECPASVEAGHGTNCADCRACGGLKAKANCDITIIAHGDVGKVRAFERKVVALKASP